MGRLGGSVSWGVAGIPSESNSFAREWNYWKCNEQGRIKSRKQQKLALQLCWWLWLLSCHFNSKNAASCNTHLKTKISVLFCHNDATTILLLQCSHRHSLAVTCMPHNARSKRCQTTLLQNAVIRILPHAALLCWGDNATIIMPLLKQCPSNKT